MTKELEVQFEESNRLQETILKNISQVDYDKE
jgi:hypothetical protein